MSAPSVPVTKQSGASRQPAPPPPPGTPLPPFPTRHPHAPPPNRLAEGATVTQTSDRFHICRDWASATDYRNCKTHAPARRTYYVSSFSAPSACPSPHDHDPLFPSCPSGRPSPTFDSCEQQWQLLLLLSVLWLNSLGERPPVHHPHAYRMHHASCLMPSSDG